MKKLGKWLRSERFHKTTSMLLTLCLIFEMMPAQSIAYARDEVAAVLGAVSEEPAEEEAVAEEIVPEATPDPEPEPEVMVEDQEGDVVSKEESTGVEPSSDQPADDQTEQQAEEQQASEQPAVDTAEEIAYPAATLESSAVKVEVGEGVLPEGTNLEAINVTNDDIAAVVKETLAEDQELVQLAAYGLRFTRAGEEVFPRGSIRVTVSNALDEGENVAVYTIADSGVAERMNDAVASLSVQQFTLNDAQATRKFAVAATKKIEESAIEEGESAEAKDEGSGEEASAEDDGESDLVTPEDGEEAAGKDSEGVTDEEVIARVEDPELIAKDLVKQMVDIVSFAAKDAAGANAETWTVTFYDRDAQVHQTVEVAKGDAIGNQLPDPIAREDYTAHWAVGEIVQGSQGPETKVTGDRIDSSWTPTADTVIVPDYDQISYTVTFYQEDKTTEVATKTVNSNTNYCLNDIPSVPVKDGYTGKWVYSGGDFSNQVAVSADTEVWAEYEQNVFTVTYKVDGATYETDTYYMGDALTLPADPVVEGRDFKGWYVGETEYNGGEEVTSDLTLEAQFDEAFAVSFVVLNDDGSVSERLSQYFRGEGEEIGTMPQDPFVAGKVFEKWVIQGTDTEVTADTEVTGNMTVVAVFRDITVYDITAEYYYLNDRGEEVIFNTDLIQVEADELPYTITAPATTQTDENEVATGPIYYVSTPTIEVKADDFDAENKCTVRFQYVSHTAEYDFVYMLKDLTGNGYTKIDGETTHQYGVLDSTVTGTVKTFPYATFESAPEVNITQTSGQEVPVYYTRKSFSVSYDTNGGSYVAGATELYGAEHTVSSTVPTRAGYTFDGWYTDAELTQQAGSTVTVEGDTTLYAKWKGDTVNYTIVYMFEKYNDTGTESSYVYDNSSTATAEVGTTVQANSAPNITRTGWEKDTDKNATSSVEIAADGSSVLFVYYKLRTYTLNFDRNNRGWIIKPDGTTTTSTYSISVKIGQDISGLWPSADSSNRYFVGWQKNGQGTRYVTKQLIMNSDLLPTSGTSVTYYACWTSSASQRTVNYYLQNADDDGYTKSTTYSQTYYSDGGTLNPKAIQGYTYDHSQNSGNSYNFYYNRNTYDIDYYYGSTKLNTIEDVKFDANINSNAYKWTPTAAQCGVDSDYTFEGWYSDSGLTTPYIFNKMPASNLVLYAKWTAPTFTVSFDTDGGTTYDNQTVSKDDKATNPGTPTKEGYVFEGWFTTADGDTLFDWNTQIRTDTTVYAHWTQKTLSYTVNYVDENGASVATSKTVTNPNFKIGDEVTENAVAVPGYRPSTSSETLTLSGNDSDNVINIVYVKKSDTTKYTVKYILDPNEYPGEEIAVATTKQEDVSGNTSSVIELAKSVDYTALYAEHPELSGIEFFPDAVEKTLVLTATESENVLTFYYSSYKNAKVTVHFKDMDGNSIANDDVQILKVGKTFTLSRTPIAGWELYKAVEGTALDGTAAGSSYKIKEETTANGLEFTLFYQKKATITANSLSKQYDGEPLTLPAEVAGQVKAEGLLDEHALSSITLSYTGNDVNNGRLDAGTATVTPGNAVISGASGNYYKVRYISGTLTVNKINVTIRVEPDRWTGNIYDGTEKQAGFTNSSKTQISDYVMISHEGYKNEYEDDIWEAVKRLDNVQQGGDGLGYYVKSEKDAGDYPYTVGLTKKMLPDDSNYSVSLFVRDGRLQILPKDVTITTGSAEKTYDGTPLTNADTTITGLVAADEGKVTLSATGTITDPGSTANTYTINWGETKASNYTVKEELGTLTVTEAVLTITVNDLTLTYNGSEQSGYTLPESIEGTGSDITETGYSVKSLANGDTLVVTYTPAKGTDAGTYTNGKFDADIRVMRGEEVVTAFYDITTDTGDLTINKAPVTITTGSDSKAYDGTALTNSEASITGLVNGETATVTATGSQTEVGSSSNTYSIDWGTTNKDNYTVTESLGTLEVTKNTAQVTLTAASDSKTYDGTALTNATVTASGLPEGFTVEATTGGSQTDAGASANVVNDGYVIKNAAGEDVTANFTNVKKVDGTLTVNPAPVTITTGSDSKAYDGTALTKAEASITGLVNGEAATVTATGSQTEVGSSSNTYTINWGTTKAGNYTVTENLGTLTVTKNGAEVVLTAASDSKTYDGTALTNAGVTASGLPEGFTVEATASGSQTDAGESANVVNNGYVIRDAQGVDKTDNFTKVTKVDGTLTVNPKAVTITTGSGSKAYDGTALTNTEATITGLVNNETATVTATGSQTEVGSSSNTYTIDWGTTKASNYTVTENLGTLTVTKNSSEVTLTAPSDSKTYDGTALTCDGTGEKKVTATGLPEGFTVDATASGSQTVAGSSANVVNDGYVIKNAADDDVTAYFTNVIKIDGTLTVNPKKLSITAGSDEKVYDGTPLTKNSYTNTDLAEGDSIESVTVTGSQTVVGSSDNVPSAAKIVNAAGEDVTASYDITYAKGTLKVTKKALTITADSGSKMYDGTALTKSTYTNSALAAGDSITSVTVTGSQTIVGKSDNVPSDAVVKNADGEDVTESYEITYVNGELEVTQKEITITADSATKVYDGTALTKNSYTNTALAANDSVESVTVTGSQTVVGSSDNVPSAAVIKNAAGADVTASYKITYANGTLEVTKKAVTITADSGTKVYDGTALTKDSYTNTDLAAGDTVFSVTVTGSQTVVGTSDNVPSAAVIKNAAGEDVTASYEITYASGTLQVTKKAVTVTAASDTKVYDGTALTKDSFTNTDLAEGDKFDSVTVTGSQTVVGSSNNVPSAAKIVNAAGEDVTASYEITYANGTLEVTKKAVTITADSATKVYDGTALTKDGYTNTDLAEGDSIDSVTVTGSQTVVGSSDNVPSDAVIKNADGDDVTSSYEITYKNGTLEVTKNQALIITADSDTKVYDGKALTKDSYQVAGLAEGDSIDSVTVTGSQTVVGTSANVPSAAKVVNAAGEDVTASYDITYANGTLEVTKKPVTVTADSDTKVYDGAALTKSSYVNTDLAEGDKVDSVTVTGSQTVVGTSDNVPSAAVIKNAAGENVTASYEIAYVNGMLEVTKKALTITAEGDTKVYDGTALTKDSYTNTDLATGDKVDSVTVTGSQTVVGTSDNVPSAAVIKNAAGEDVTTSYDITYANGTLEVTKKAVTITADSGTKVYDGTALIKDSYTNSDLAAGDIVSSVIVTGSQTVVGTSDNVPSKAKIVSADGKDVTESYEITYADGTLEVTKKALTITADSDTKVYDGTALTKDSFANTALAEGDKVDSVTVNGSQTIVGKSDNVASKAKIVNAAGEDVTASYEITYVKGSLEVTQMPLTITADSATKVYDGTALTKDSYTNTDLAEGDSIDSVTVTGSQTVVGSSDNVPSDAKIVNADGEDVTASYKITYANGTLEVTLNQALIITADSDTKVYDGTALTKNSYKVSGLADGDSVESVTVTGSQTVAGTSDNVPSAAKIVNAKGEDVTASYAITYENGTLEVTQKTLTVTADSDSKVYDGTALTKDSYTNTALATGDAFESVKVTGSQTTVGESANTPSSAKVVNADGEDVTASYAIAYVNGALKVTPKDITITADSDAKIYDGTALTKDSYTNTALAEGDSIDSVTVTGSQTVVGSSYNVPSAAKVVNADGEDVTGSYAITYANGTLEVTKKSLTITAASDTKVYDGTALTKDSFTNTALAEGDKVDSVTVTGSQTVVGSSNNVPSAAVIKNVAGEDVTASYDITYAKGTLEVTKKAVTITADSDTKVYDGTALTKDSYTSTALAEGDKFESVTVTGSQTVVGSSDNVPSAAVIKNADGDDVTSSYEITYKNGTLEVTKNAALIITADSDTKVYDGTALTKDSYQVAGLAKGDSVESVTVTGSQTVVGTSDNVPSAAKVVNAKGEDVTASYDITYTKGTLEVTKKPVTVTADSETKVYDGTALTKDSFANTDLAEGDKFDSVTVTGSQTVVGSSANVPSAAVIKNAAGQDVTASYEITYVNGTLEVTKKALTITADSADKVYDGTALTKDSYTNTALAAGDKVDSVTVTGSQTVVGTSDNVPSKAKVVNAAGDDVTASYDITYTKGTLEVTKRSVTLTSATDTKVYDGTALTNDKVTVGGDGFAEGEGATYDVTGTQTEAGSSDNSFTYALDEGTKADNYTISKTEGTLTVTPITDEVTVTITENSGTETYDGTEKTVTGYTVSIDNKLYTEEDFEFTGDAAVKGTDAGTYNMELKPEDFKNVSENFAKVTFVIVDGTLTINKRSVTLTSATDTKVYDGRALTNDEVTVGGDGFAEGEGATYDVTGTQTVVGSSNNTFTYSLNKGTKAANYEITKNEGTLTVTNREAKYEITVEANSAKATYDGQEHSAKGFKTLTFEVEGNTYTVSELTTEDPTQTDAGTYTNNITGTALVKDADGNDVTSEFAVAIVNGSLEIAKRKVTLTSATDTKVYDGTALTNDKVTVGGDGFAEGEGATYDVTGTQTVVGSSDNSFTYALDEGTKADNYEITKTEGTLTVTPVTDEVTVTITENSGTEKYDGTEKTITGYTWKASDPLYTEDCFEFSGDATVKGTDAGTYEMALKPADFENTSKNFSKVTFVIVDGTLTINKRNVTLTSATDEKVYDGTALTNNKVTVGGDGFAEGEGAAYAVTGHITEVGETSNIFNYVLNEGTKADNYEITKTEGTLTVTPVTDEVTVTITENSGTETYDGTEKTVTGYTVSIDNELYTEEDFEFTGDATVKGTDAGTYEMALKPEDFKNTSKNFSKVTFKIVDGKLVIEPAQVTVTADNKSKVYGEDDPELTADVNGALNGDEIKFSVTRAEGEDVGTYAITPAGDEVQGNYKVSYVPGTLTITSKPIDDPDDPEKFGPDFEVTGPEDTVYNGKQQKQPVTVKDTKTGGDVTADITYSDDVTNVGTVTVTITGTGNYTGTVTKTYKITKAPLTISTESAEKKYDGEPLTAGGSIDGLVNGETVSFAATGSQTDVGESDNTYSLAWDGTASESNYEVVSEELGTLKVTKSGDNTVVPTPDPEDEGERLDVDSKSITVKYDGARHTVSAEATVSEGTTIEYSTDGGKTWSTEAPSRKNAGSVEFSVRATNPNYEDAVAEGWKLVVTPREVTLTSATDEKPFDGKPLTNDEVTVSGDGFVEGEGASYDVTGSQTYVGSSENTFTYTLNEGTREGNYVIRTENGTLTVTSRDAKYEILAEANSGEFDYDGSEHTVSGLKTNTFEVDGNTYTLGGMSATRTETEAGSYPVVVTGTPVVMLNGENVTSQFKVSTKDGSLVINRKSIEPDPDDPESYDFVVDDPQDTVYNGKQQKQPVTVTDKTTGKPATVEVTYSDDVTNVGTVTVTITGTGNYTGTVTRTYKITPRTVTLTSASDEKPFDGKPLTNDEVTVSGDGFVEGEGASYDVTGSQTYVGSSENTFTYTLNEGTKATNYDITVVNGTLTVTDKDVDDDLVVTKTHEGEQFDSGEKVEFTVTATNIYDAPQTITLTEIEGVTLAQTSFENVVAGETVETTATYTITESDVRNGKFTNTVTATIGDLSKKAEDSVTTAEKNSHLTVTKETTSTAKAEDGKYALDEEITYKITVTNDGNMTLSDVSVVDKLEGFTFDEGQKTEGITLAPGESASATGTYVVTEADVLAGSVKNEATATGIDPEGEDPTVDPGDTTDPTEKPAPKLTSTKTSTGTMTGIGDDGNPAYTVGDEMTYTITVTNDGNLTATDIKVVDEKLGYTEAEPFAYEGEIAPGETVTVLTKSYVVTEEDVAAGSVLNEATVTGTTKGGDPDPAPSKDEKPVDKTFTITYVPNGGNFNGSTENVLVKAKYGEVITIIDAPVRDGYTFTYWKGSEFQPGDKYTVTGDHVFTAQWKKNEPAKPAKPSTSTKTTQTVTPKKTLPKTGDIYDPTLTAGIATLGLLAMAFGLRKKRKEA